MGANTLPSIEGNIQHVHTLVTYAVYIGHAHSSVLCCQLHAKCCLLVFGRKELIQSTSNSSGIVLNGMYQRMQHLRKNRKTAAVQGTYVLYH